ncbi:MAG: hypothetical protein K2X38_03275 [Gemmataceae bacterium]|nr:hypothetical protein [Gemmataceae bacterium]
MVRALPAERFQKELRLFGAACVRRIWHLLPASCRLAVEASEQFAHGQIAVVVLTYILGVADREAVAQFPGHSAPNAAEYAASAAIDASSFWPRTASNVLAAASCAALAAACAAGEADETRYDEAFEKARAAESAGQADLLRGLVSVPPNQEREE